MTDRYLVLFDADHIRDYVFASGRLREIRGASERVRQLTNGERLRDAYGSWSSEHDTGVIYAGGGAGAIVVRGEEAARRVCRSLERHFRTGTGSATLSAVWVQINDDSISGEADAQEEAARALARRKASRVRAESMPGGPVRFCSSDRIRPANGFSLDPKGEIIFVNHATATRQRVSREYRDSFLDSEIWKRLKHLLPADNIATWEHAVSPRQDIGSIGAQSDPEGYVALVYADGDGIGRTMRDVVRNHGFMGYQAFSESLTDAAHAATASALATSYGARPPSVNRLSDAEEAERPGRLPFEVITIGGDDILLLCTADQGLTVACELASAFHRDLQANVEKHRLKVEGPLTASVGVVIAHESMPILVLERAGRELLKSAKDVSGGGGIDFQIVTSTGIDRLSGVRERQYQSGTTTVLTKRPYRLADAMLLLDAARRIRKQDGGDDVNGLSGSTIAALFEACHGDMAMAALEVLSIQSRLGAQESQLLIDALGNLGDIRHYPFSSQDDKNRHSTALLDLLEAGEFAGQPWGDQP